MVRCGAVHTCFIDQCMMSDGSDPLSSPFTSKTGQSHSVVHKTDDFFFLKFTSTYRLQKGHILAFYRHNFRLLT